MGAVLAGFGLLRFVCFPDNQHQLFFSFHVLSFLNDQEITDITQI